jgi:DNA-binding Lrp family transcriptional regulator
MDHTDLRLLAMLNMNSRAPFRELAEKLGLSVQAVHTRVQDLVGSHVIVSFTANLSFNYLRSVRIGLYGLCTAKNLNEVLKELGNNDCTSTVHRSGDFVYAQAVLRSLSDLEQYVEFVKKTTSMDSPVVNLPSAMGFSELEGIKTSERPIELSHLDYQIILSLHKNSRKETAEIAKELGISVPTVKRRLERLIDAKVIDFSTVFHAGDQSGFISVVILRLKSGVNKGAFISELRKRFEPRIIYMNISSNIPNTMSVFMWSASMRDSRDMESVFETDSSVESFNNYLIQYQYWFPTWRETMLEEKAKEIVK